MKIRRISNVKGLPRSKELIMYSVPFFAIPLKDGQSEEEHAIECSVYEYEQKYGREPKTVYIHGNNLFIPVGSV